VNLEKVYPSNIPPEMWFYCIASVFIIVAIATICFFNSPKITPSIKNDFIFGLLIVTFGFIGGIAALAPHKNGLDILY